MNKYAIAVHGGAGTILRSGLTPEREVMYREALRNAIIAGEKILESGGSSVDAVEIAVKLMEDNELFNAGKGSVFTHEGKNEMDAAIMDGRILKAGAIACVKHVKNPVALARLVMEKSQHVFLCGQGAQEFAEKMDVEFMPDDYFFVQSRYDQLLHAIRNESIVLDHSKEEKKGTVGAVAMDMHGNLAAATSTGGMTNKRYGRVGDSPIIGAGTYANNNTCAISCTGHGEFFIRSVVAYDVSCLMEYKGLGLKEACETVVLKKLVETGGEGGLIAVDKNGNVELVFNSEGMYRGMKQSGSELYIGIYKD